jgi:hypothetical protein
LWEFWAGSCTPAAFDAAGITEAWDPSTVTINDLPANEGWSTQQTAARRNDSSGDCGQDWVNIDMTSLVSRWGGRLNPTRR